MINSFLKAALSIASPEGRRARLSVFIYHRVLAEPDKLLNANPSAKEFDWQMSLIAKYFHVLPTTEAVKHLKKGTLPARAACITFDDGFADNLHVAMPILKKHQLPATVFVSTGYLNGGIMFNDLIAETLKNTVKKIVDLSTLGLGDRTLTNNASRRQAYFDIIGKIRYQPVQERLAFASAFAEQNNIVAPTNLMLDESGVQKLHQAGITIGAHTVNHPILAQCSDDNVTNEIIRSKKTLETVTSAPVDLFAYPNGRPEIDYGQREIEAIKHAGFTAAFSTINGAAKSTQQNNLLYQIPRFTPWDKTSTRFLARSLRNYLYNYREQIVIPNRPGQ